MIPHDEFDSPWKEIITQYFEQFVAFFFPEAAAEIDWRRGYDSLDKELRQITREAELGVRLVDNLLKVWKKSGEETWVLIHVEIQAQEQEHFAHRTYVYHYRIHDLYHRPVASFAVLADANPDWRPSEYAHQLWGCQLDFRFPVVKILDYANRQQTLEGSNNPFAVVVLAHLKTLETKKDDDQRRYWKVRLTKELYQGGFTKDEIIRLYRFIDWMMVLPKELEWAAHQEILTFEKEQRMQYITTAERFGMEKGWFLGHKKGCEEGRVEGRVEGLEKGDLIGQIRILQEIHRRSVSSTEELVQRDPQELQDMLRELKAKIKG